VGSGELFNEEKNIAPIYIVMHMVFFWKCLSKNTVLKIYDNLLKILATFFAPFRIYLKRKGSYVPNTQTFETYA
jgi:hypothetical protein